MAVRLALCVRTLLIRGELVDSARRLFGERGYANVSVDEIALGATATKGAFYHHFRDKLELFLDGCADPSRAQIDAPAVLGWQARREIDCRHGLGILVSVLREGMKAGLLERQPVRPLAHLILGAALEGGMLIANATHSSRARASVAQPLLRILERLAVAQR